MSNRQRFEGAQLEEVLERVRTELGPDATIVRADKVRTGGVGGFFQKETYEVHAEAAELPASTAAPGAGARSISELADQVSDAELAPQVSTESPSFGAAMRRFTHEYADEFGNGAGSFDDVLGDAMADAVPDPVGASAASREVGLRPLAPPCVPGMVPTLLCEPDASMLGRLGLPSSLVPPDELGRRDLRRALVERLGALPVAPPVPRDPGGVIAVIGDSAGALAMARRMAGELHIEEEDVLLAAVAEYGVCIPPWLHLSEPELIARRRRTWWRRPHPTLVAIDAPMSVRHEAWAPSVVDALEPSMTLGIVDARCKPEDVEAWSQSLGGFDALALENTAETFSPAAVLRLPIPVARLDGRVATPERWANLLVKRLAA
ncbi:MAG: hypothetical protein WEC34_03125 [Acidimicrobiia bacterium]|jgi:hypothetical protein